MEILAQPANVMTFSSSTRTLRDTNPVATDFHPSAFQWGIEPAFRIQDHLDSIYYLIPDLMYANNEHIGSDKEEDLYLALYYISQLVESSHDASVLVGDTLVNKSWIDSRNTNRMLFPIVRLSSVDLDSLGTDQSSATNNMRNVQVRGADHLESSQERPQIGLPEFLNNSHWGLDAGFGFYSFITHPESYYVDGSGRVETQKLRGGTHMLLSAHLYWTQNERDKFFLCLPIVALTGTSESRIGLISSRQALGLGYARMLKGMGVYVSFVSAPYEQYNQDLLSTIEPGEPRFEKVDLSEYPSTTRHHLITSFRLNIPIY